MAYEPEGYVAVGVVNTACRFCLGPTGNDYVVYAYDAICDRCLEKIVALAEQRRAALGEAAKGEPMQCPVCGEPFANKGALLAHRKRCGKGYADGLKTEVLA